MSEEALDVVEENPVEQDDANQPVEAVENAVETPPVGEATEPEEGDEQPVKKNRFQERISSLTHERDEERQKREQAEAYIAQQQRLAQQQQQVASQQNWEQQWKEHKPRPSQFDTESEYEKAFDEWKAVGFHAQHQAAMQAQAEQQYRQQMAQQQQALSARLSEVTQAGQAKYADFLEVMSDPAAVKVGQVNPDAARALINSDMAAELSYYLAKNPEVTTSFAGLSQDNAYRAIYALEQQLKGPTQAPVTRQDHPPAKVRGSGGGSPDREPSDINEWMEWRNKQIDAHR